MDDITFGPYSLINSGGIDIFVAKIDADGNWLWATQASGYAFPSEITIDSSGNFYLTGYFSGDIIFGSNSLSSPYDDIFVAKIDADGNWIWASQAGGSAADRSYAITVDSSNCCIITGDFVETANFGSTSLNSQGNQDIFVAKIDTDGNWVWAIQAGGYATEGSYDITIDDNGNSYITGDFSASATFGSYSLTSQGSWDVFVAGIDVNGNWLWVTLSGGNGYDSGRCIAKNNSGNIVLSGFFSNTATFGSYPLSSCGGSDIYVAEIDVYGNWVSVIQGGGNGDEFVSDIEISDNGDKTITGFFENSSSFGSFFFTSYGSQDIFVANCVLYPIDFTADFTANPTSGNYPLETQFTDLSYIYTTIWEWDFNNDGLIDSYEQNPTYVFEQSGLYTVSLTSSDGTNTDTEIKVDYITVNAVYSDDNSIPTTTKLHQNFPNPFNPATTIEFNLEQNAEIQIEIYNMKGQKVKTFLINPSTHQPIHSVVWNGDNDNNNPVSSGIYFYKLKSGNKTMATKKCLLLK